MLVSGGKLIAIDNVNTDGSTVSGDGVETAITVNTDYISTVENVSNVSSTLYTDIQTISSNFDNYYTKSETSGSEQLTEEFDTIKTSIKNYDLVSLTPDNLYAGISADSTNSKVYVVSATDAQDKLEFDSEYNPETNKVATVETVKTAIQTVKPVILEYNKTVSHTWEELQTLAPNVYATIHGSDLYELAVVNDNILIFRQHAAAHLLNDEHSQINVTELQLYRNLTWNNEVISYTVIEPWSDNGTGIVVSNGRVSANVDDSTIKINESNQLYTVQDIQNVIYDATKWSELATDKRLVLNVSVDNSELRSSVYQKTDTYVVWILNQNDKLYFVKLTDADVWSMTEISIGSAYSAGYGLTLTDQEFSVDETVIASNDTVTVVSAKLSSDISKLEDQFDNYYTKTETSGKDELAAEFAKYQEHGDYLSANALDSVSR